MATRDEFSKFAFSLAALLPRYAPNFRDREVLDAWYTQLGSHSISELREAFLTATRAFDEFPSVAKLRRVIERGSTSSDDQMGQDIATRIETAIGRFGSYHPREAETYIGHFGWEVVSQLGGWSRVCETTYDQLMSARKQWRELAAIVSQKATIGAVDAVPRLPTRSDHPLRRALDVATGKTSE